MMTGTSPRVWFVLALGLAACGPTPQRNGDTPDATPAECTSEGSHRCVGATYQTCTGGSWQTAVDCPIACLDSVGCVQCTPGQQYCQDGNVWACDSTGNGGTKVQDCTGSSVCSSGTCVDACADAAANKSYIGCEYWAVDLDNAVEVLGPKPSLFGCKDSAPFGYGAGAARTTSVCTYTGSDSNKPGYAGLCDPPGNACPTDYACQTKNMCLLDAMQSPFAIVVSNPQARTVNVTVTGPGGQTITKAIAAGEVQAIKPQDANAIPDQSVDGTLKAKKAYKITSDLPIVAYQFNPLDNVDVFSNDASLLLPRTAYDTDYYTLSWPTLDRRNPAPGVHNYHGYLTVVAWQDGTQIEVTPTVATEANASQATLAAGTPVTFTLNAYEVMQLQAAGTGDLTGTHITSPNDKSFGVFGGHEAALFGEANSPDANYPSRCCADHLEEMLFPSTTWGKSFAIARTKQRLNEPDLLRVMAQKNGTTVTFTPAPASGTCGTLNAGQFCEVKIAGNTEVVASEPVMIGHFIESSTWTGLFGKIGSGDPSMAIAVPSEQFRRDYTILVPAQYAKNYVSIAAPATGGVLVDGTAVTLTPFPGGAASRGAIVELTAGQHKITCADGCGITVYGYSDAVSYMFAGGLDLKPLVIL